MNKILHALFSTTERTVVTVVVIGVFLWMTIVPRVAEYVQVSFNEDFAAGLSDADYCRNTYQVRPSRCNADSKCAWDYDNNYCAARGAGGGPAVAPPAGGSGACAGRLQWKANEVGSACTKTPGCNWDNAVNQCVQAQAGISASRENQQATACGNGICEVGETTATCTRDCPPPPAGFSVDLKVNRSDVVAWTAGKLDNLIATWKVTNTASWTTCMLQRDNKSPQSVETVGSKVYEEIGDSNHSITLTCGDSNGQTLSDTVRTEYRGRAARDSLGSIDSVDKMGTVSGWMLQPTKPGESIMGGFVIYREKGKAPPQSAVSRAAEFRADLPGQDVNQNTGFEGNHRFRFDIPYQYGDGTLWYITVYALPYGSGEDTSNIQRALNEVPFRISKPALNLTVRRSSESESTRYEGPIAVKKGEQIRLYWESRDMTLCSSNFGGIDINGLQGYIVRMDVSKTFTITCSGPGGSVGDSVTVNVQ